MSRLRPCLVLAAGIVLAVAGAGCSTGPSPVSGTVTLNGTPLPRCQVDLTPVNPKGRPAYGVTDEQGRFTLTTFKDGDGALRGEYKVSFTLLGDGLTPEDMKKLNEMTDARQRASESHKLQQKNQRKEGTLHSNYKSPETTPKTLKVPASDVKFELKMEGT